MLCCKTRAACHSVVSWQSLVMFVFEFLCVILFSFVLKWLLCETPTFFVKPWCAYDLESLWFSSGTACCCICNPYMETLNISYHPGTLAPVPAKFNMFKFPAIYGLSIRLVAYSITKDQQLLLTIGSRALQLVTMRLEESGGWIPLIVRSTKSASQGRSQESGNGENYSHDGTYSTS